MIQRFIIIFFLFTGNDACSVSMELATMERRSQDGCPGVLKEDKLSDFPQDGFQISEECLKE